MKAVNLPNNWINGVTIIGEFELTPSIVYLINTGNTIGLRESAMLASMFKKHVQGKKKLYDCLHAYRKKLSIYVYSVER